MKLLIEFGAVIVTVVITILIMSIVHMSSFGGRTAIAAAVTAFGTKLGRMPNLPALHTLLDLVAIDRNMVCFPTMLAWLISFRGRDK